MEILAKVDRSRLPAAWAQHWRVLDLWLVSETELPGILADLPAEPPQSLEVAATFRWHVSVARAQLVLGDLARLDASLARLDAVIATQKSPVQRRLAEVLHSLRNGNDQLGRLLAGWPSGRDTILGVFASDVLQGIGALSEVAFATVERAALASPHRWRDATRDAMARETGVGLQRAATILDEIGERGDVVPLREVSRRLKRTGHAWGNRLIRRLAPPVLVQDLGAMSLVVGDRQVEGHQIRKKVLALLAFLACQPGGSATPDQILDALWPELRPDQGINSVHQTIYFLRRIIDPEYRAGHSADYLHFDDDIVTFDRTLVDCASWRCRRLLDSRPETQRSIEELLDEYRGRFSSDFAYEDWASPYRDTLHAAYLSIAERAVAGQSDHPTHDGACGSASGYWRSTRAPTQSRQLSSRSTGSWEHRQLPPSNMRITHPS